MESTRRQMSCGLLTAASVFFVVVLSANTIHATPLQRSQDSVSTSISELLIEDSKITRLIDQMLSAVLEEPQTENSRALERKLLSLLGEEVSTERGILRRIREARKHHASRIIYPESITDKIRNQIRSVKYVRRIFKSSKRGDDSSGCVLNLINSGVPQNDAFIRCQRT